MVLAAFDRDAVVSCNGHLHWPAAMDLCRDTHDQLSSGVTQIFKRIKGVEVKSFHSILFVLGGFK